MRIIGGFYRSRPIKMVESTETRETVDKVRGAIFNIINPYFDSGIVLDLFAGSGAMGLEAISRGASKVYFNDNSDLPIQTINENIDYLKVKNQCFVLKKDYKKALESLKNIKFDLIFLDPPYDLTVHNDIISYILEENMLNYGGLIVVEYKLEDTILNHGLTLIKEKAYGIRKITVLIKEN